jgi:hypothetical protein
MQEADRRNLPAYKRGDRMMGEFSESEAYALGDGIRIFLPKRNLRGSWVRAKKVMDILLGVDSPACMDRQEPLPMPKGSGPEQGLPTAPQGGLEKALEDLAELRKAGGNSHLKKGQLAKIAEKWGVSPAKLSAEEWRRKGGNRVPKCMLCSHYVRSNPLEGTCELGGALVKACHSCGEFKPNPNVITKGARVEEQNPVVAEALAL